MYYANTVLCKYTCSENRTEAITVGKLLTNIFDMFKYLQRREERQDYESYYFRGQYILMCKTLDARVEMHTKEK